MSDNMATSVAASTVVPGPTSSRSFPLRILVNSDVVGAIIGRSGNTIRSITQQTKARIDVHREESPDQKEKVITITGSPDSCSEACYQILKICHDEYNAPNLYRPDIPDTEDIGQTYPNPELDTLCILAPSNLIGRLIGRGGASIKKMMEQTSTKIKITVNGLTESTGEHTISVVGNLEQIRQAEKLISSKLRTAQMSDIQVSIQAMNQQSYLFNNVPLPYLASSSFASPHQTPLIASMVNSQAGHGSNGISRSVPMNHQSQMNSPLYSGPPGGYMSLYPNMSGPHAAPGGLVGFNSILPSRFESERETVYIYIPSTMVGAIIGKSGAAIKEMISTSGAIIKVATSPPSTTSMSTLSVSDQSTVKSSEAAQDKDSNDKKSEQNLKVTSNVDSSSTSSTSDLPPKSENGISDKRDVQASHETTNEQRTEQIPSKANNASSSGNITSNNRPHTNGNETPSKHDDVQASPASRKSLARHRHVNLSDTSLTRKVTILGYPASQYSAQYQIYRKVSMESAKNDVSLMVEINVPSHLIGKMIGKGGVTIKNLQKQTRTTIRLPEDKFSQSNQQAASAPQVAAPSQSSNVDPSAQQLNTSGGDNNNNNSNHTPNNNETIVQIIGEFEGSQAAQRHIRRMIYESQYSSKT